MCLHLLCGRRHGWHGGLGDKFSLPAAWGAIHRAGELDVRTTWNNNPRLWTQRRNAYYSDYSIPMYTALVVLGISWHVYAVLYTISHVRLSQLAESGAAGSDFQTFERLIRNFAKGLPKVLCKVSLCTHCSRCLCYAGSMPLSWVSVADMRWCQTQVYNFTGQPSWVKLKIFFEYWQLDSSKEPFSWPSGTSTPIMAANHDGA